MSQTVISLLAKRQASIDCEQFKCGRKRHAKGFTLVELMVVLAIVGILLAVALPDFVRSTRGMQLAHQAKEMEAAIKFTRAEAIRRGQVVTLCRSNTAQDACRTGGSTTWHLGWMVYVDVNANRTYALADDGAQIAIKQAMSTGITVNTANLGNIADSISFNPAGDLVGTPNSNGKLTFDYAGSPVNTQMYLILNTAGRVRVLNYDQCMLANSGC